MKFKVIKGTFHVSGYAPDGDSIRFQAENKKHWDFYRWNNNKNKAGNKKQLRFEAIDALETHYEGFHQPRAFGVAALEVLLDMIGIKDVLYNIAMTKIVSAADNTPGYIASSTLDKYDRPVSFVFPGDARLIDGDEIDAGDLPLEYSVNLMLLKRGLVYPTFYSSMQDEMIEIFSLAAKKAREEGIGVWSLDKTLRFTLWNKDTIENDIVILPKLFRRLTSFFIEKGNYDELPGYLAKSKDSLLIRATGQKKMLHEIMEINGRQIRVNELPEDILFDPKG